MYRRSSGKPSGVNGTTLARVVPLTVSRKPRCVCGLVVAGPRLSVYRNPVADLHRKEIVPSRSERSGQIVEAHSAHDGLRAILVLCPHEVERAAGPPLPAQHGIAAE